MKLDIDAKSLEIVSVLDMSWKASTDICKARNFCALSYRISGNSAFSFGDSHFDVRTGDMVYIPQGVEYISDHAEEHIIAIHFISDAYPKSPFAVAALHIPEAGKAFQELLDAFIAKADGWEYKTLSLFYGILAKLCEESANDDNNISSKRLLAEKAAGIIRRDFRSNTFSVSLVCEELGVSGTYLRKVFAEAFGASPSEYLAALRLEYATELLKSGYCTISQIAQMSGFSDSKYFSRFISRKTGMSPTEYREKLHI